MIAPIVPGTENCRPAQELPLPGRPEDDAMKKLLAGCRVALFDVQTILGRSTRGSGIEKDRRPISIGRFKVPAIRGGGVWRVHPPHQSRVFDEARPELSTEEWRCGQSRQ